MENVILCLKWYIENDDTNFGPSGNEYWLEGRRRAIDAMLEIDPDYIDPDI
jgi:hypothetical protein